MPYRITLSELALLNEEDRDRALTSLVDAARRDGAEMRSILEARVRRFEAQYKLTSEAMLVELGEGRLAETPDIAEWLFLLGSLNFNAQHETRP